MRSLNGSAKDPEMVASLAPPPPIEPTAQGSQRGATIRHAEPAVPGAALGARPSTAFERALSPSLRVAICRKRISFRHEASALPFELLELL